MLRTIQFVVVLVIVTICAGLAQIPPAHTFAADAPSPISITPVASTEVVGPIAPERPVETPTPAAIVTFTAPEVVSPPPAAFQSGCPDGGPQVSEAQMVAWAADHDWGPYSAAQMGLLFQRESGGCVAIISPSNDHGCTQINYAPDRDRRWNFARIRSDCAYAIAVANEHYWERGGGRAGITAWYAGKGWLW